MYRFPGNGEICKLLKHTVERQQDQCCGEIEAGVDNGNVNCTGCIVNERPGVEQTNTIECQREQQYAYNIKVQMHKSGTAGVTVCTNGGNHCRDAGANVLAQNNWNCGAKGNGTGGTEALQDTYRGRGGLDNCGQGSANKNAKQGVGEGYHELCKPRLIFKEFHGAAHKAHTGHKCHKAQQNGAYTLMLIVLGEHIKNYAYGAQQGSQS